MQNRLTTPERAFQLAAAGICRSVADIRRQLRKEGYEAVEEHTTGFSIQAQLKAALAARSA